MTTAPPDPTPSFWSRALASRQATLAAPAMRRLGPRLETLVSLVTRAFARRRQVLLFGNGGSAATAEHAAAEWVGRFGRGADALPALALTTTGAVLTALSNDYGYEELFARQVEAHGRRGDVAIGLSTSGTSANVVRGLRAARRRELATVALLGPSRGRVGRSADLVIRVPASSTALVQELHDCVLHVVADEVDRRLAAATGGRPGPARARTR